MKKILVVEDDLALLEMLRSFLETENFNVVSSSDGEEGCRLARQKEIDLIILDYGLPSLDGFEVCRRLRAEGIATPIIILSGKKRTEMDKVLGFEIGADDYVTKPFGTKELLARIKAVLHRSKPEAKEDKQFVARARTLEMPRKLSRGTIFAGRYEVIEELGEGGMANVYKVLDKKIEEEVALKLMKPDIADRETIERFRNELKTARKISQRNVCRMYDLSENKGTHYITMEYVPGEDLDGSIRRMGPLSAGKAIFIAKQICEGLSEAHRLGVVHRDLKPQNIMVDKDGNARIMDFGIAHSIKTKGITGAGEIIGTPEYMSPEQVEGKDVDLRSDIYSLGVVLFEMLSGRQLFEGDSPLSIALKQKSEAPKDPREFNAQIPEALSRLILKCLEKDRNKRYQNVEDILYELIKIEKEVPSTERILHRIMPEAESTSAVEWKNSIAMLPFADLSPEKDQEYFCEGMANDIITKLSRMGELKVISRTSVMRYKNTDKNIKEIGQELGVATILEGSIRKEKDNIRVSAQLINVEDGFHLWADSYDRKLDSVFEVQENVSKAIAEALKVKLTPRKRKALKTDRPPNIEVYEYCLKGMHFIDSKYIIYHREDDFKTAIKMFKKANEIDPNYVFIYTGLTWAYQHHYQITGNKKDVASVIKNAEKAYELNPDISETIGAIAWVSYLRGDYEKAYQSLKRAVEINPNRTSLNHVIALFYRNFGLLRQSVVHTSRSIELDPFYIPSHSLRARCLIYTGELEKAETYIKNAVEIEPENFWSLQDYSLFHIMKREVDKAEEFLVRAEKINPGYPGNRFYRALLFAVKGEKKKALALSKTGVIYSLLGMKDKAIKYMDERIQKGIEHFQYSYLPLINNTFYDGLRDDSRFKEIVERQKEKYEDRLKKHGKL
jgi:serine/threonine protein kinase/CheY-like chemotaxis protein/Tfp pilus assembly protein PilF